MSQTVDDEIPFKVGGKWWKYVTWEWQPWLCFKDRLEIQTLVLVRTVDIFDGVCFSFEFKFILITVNGSKQLHISILDVIVNDYSFPLWTKNLWSIIFLDPNSSFRKANKFNFPYIWTINNSYNEFATNYSRVQSLKAQMWGVQPLVLYSESKRTNGMTSSVLYSCKFCEWSIQSQNDVQCFKSLKIHKSY